MGQQIYAFSAELNEWGDNAPSHAKKILGGKGAGLVQMCQLGLPVPPGFTITTEVCNEIKVLKEGAYVTYFDTLMAEVDKYDTWLGQQFGYMPLVSVRSGAPVSMPGMMDTILNVGLTDETLPEWEKRLGERAALDSYRRLIQMLGATAYGVPHGLFEAELHKWKTKAAVEQDSELPCNYLRELVAGYKEIFLFHTTMDFPQTRYAQMVAAIQAVFLSWMNPRAIEYRKLNSIDEAMGTAVNVQAMVFGNMGSSSGTGVLFTRNPSTGADTLMGEFLQDAQGEDVVAGIRTPVDLVKMKDLPGAWNSVYHKIISMCEVLEDAYKDMVDVEFTVQEGKLYILQSRAGKRSARAAFKIAVDMASAGEISRTTALSRLTTEQFKVMKRPSIDPSFKDDPHRVGLPACPGVVSGRPVYSAEDAVNCIDPCILISHETTPDDIAGMNAALGILTQTGGATSHAAVVARAMDKPCVVGCTALNLQAMQDLGVDWVTIDGSTGNIWFQTKVPVIDSTDDPYVKEVAVWCLDEHEFSEAVTVDQGLTAHMQIVQASHWWGNTEVAEAVFDSLAALPNRTTVGIDLTDPNDLTQLEDAHVTGCFGEWSDFGCADFRTALVAALVARQNELKGLLVKGDLDPGEVHALELAGYEIEVAAPQQHHTAVPADYAVFSVLGA